MKLMLKKNSKVSSELLVTNNSKFFDKIGNFTYSNTNTLVTLDFLKFKKYINSGIKIDNNLKIKLKNIIIIVANE